MHTANIENRPCVKWLLIRCEKQRKIIETSAMICGRGHLQEVVVSERFQLQSFDWENLSVLDRWSLMEGGC